MKDFSKQIEAISQRLDQLESLSAEMLNRENTAVFIVDMIGGFAKKGALYSQRTEKLIPKIASFAGRCKEKGIEVITFADSHPSDSPEFEGYPPHCLEGSEESAVVKELSGYPLFHKNSTNAIFAPGFLDWLSEKEGKQQFVVTGVCTDICIYQFAVALKCWFNQKNRKTDIIVPLSMVDTFELGIHSAELFNLIFWNSMLDNGVKLVKDIQ